MTKLIKIKTTNKKMEVATPTSILNIELLQSEIVTSKESKELNKPAVQLIELKEAFKNAEQKLKEIVAEKTAQANEVKNKIAELEQLIKAQAIKTVEVTTKNKVNKTTGEVTKKTEHNLDTRLFSYTPSSKTAVIDTKEILSNPDKYKKFLKPVTTYDIDFEAINNAKSEELPWVEKNNEAKISMKQKLSKDIAETIIKETKALEVKNDK